MKKVLFVMNTMGHGGAEVALLELLRRLNPVEYEISLYVLMGQGEMVRELPGHVKIINKWYDDTSVLSKEGKKHMKKNILKRMFSRGMIIRRIPYLLKTGFGMLRKGKLLPDKLLWRVLSDGGERFEECYDLAVAYLEGGATYYVADHVKAKKKVAFLHTDYERAGYTRKLDRDCYLNYDKVFTVSKDVKDMFLKIYPECEEKTDVFHNILNQDMIRSKSQLPGGFTDEFQGTRILSVGRLTVPKAFEVSIEAMRLLKDKGENVRWYVLGEGDQRKKLEELVKELHLEQDFLMPGEVSNPYPYMAQADIYVQASRYEGKSIAVQEAQILGKPILVSDCKGNREQVVVGVDGLMCQLKPEEICKGIQEFLHDEKKRQQLGMAASKKNEGMEAEVYKLTALI